MHSPRATLDLHELARRENEQVEWKEGVADIDDVVKTLSAFANDWQNLGGGYVVCGAREGRDEFGFPRVALTGLDAARLREVEGRVLTRCRERVSPPITPLVEHVDTADPARRVLVFVIPATGHAHSFRRDADGGKFYIRVGSSTEVAQNGRYRELLIRKRALEPWDRRPNSTATVDDLDLLVLREVLVALRGLDRPVEDFVSDELRMAALMPPLCAREPLTGTLRPRNFALLLFGKDVTRFFPGAYAIYSRYQGDDRSDRHLRRVEAMGPLLSQIRVLKELLREEAHLVFDKEHASRPNVRKYPERALDEAVVNALVHRDYELDDPVRVTGFADRIEIYSPGDLVPRVDRQRFLAGLPNSVWRNQALTWLCMRLQIAQGEGQGVPTIIRAMREEGCPEPEFILGEGAVLCTLRGNPRLVGNTGLVVGFDAMVEAPAEARLAEVVTVPLSGSPDLGTRLRAWPVDHAAWQRAMDEVDRGIQAALARPRRALEVFVVGPYPAALYLGRRLDDLGRSRHVIVHQVSHGRSWFALSQGARAGARSYFREITAPLVRADGDAVVLAIEGQTPLDMDDVIDAAKTWRASVYHLRCLDAAPLTSERAGRIREELEEAIAAIHERQRVGVLHVVTSAPVGVLVELGRLLRPSVYRSVVAHVYEPPQQSHVPVLDVIRRTIAPAAPLDQDPLSR